MIYYGPNFNKDNQTTNLTDGWNPDTEYYPENLTAEEIQSKEIELNKQEAVIMKNIEAMIAECELDISTLEYSIQQIESLGTDDLATKLEISRKKAEIKELEEKILRLKETR